jgi:hypothetical protein
MAIFPNLEIEAIVQMNDRTRLDASKSFSSKGTASFTLVEIEPFSGNGFIDVTGTKSSDWFTDWEYTSAGTQTVTVRINGSVTSTKTISVVTESADALFATDQDLATEEPDILKYVKKGRNTFKDVHREAQSIIVKFFDDKGLIFADGTKITKDAVFDKAEVRQWAKYLALHLIYMQQSNAVDDIFSKKADFYKSKMLLAQQTNLVRLDLNKDGVVEIDEGFKISSSFLTRW